ncbi:hypothetical protein [Streptomyces sp. NPDC052042]|uniref:hypothetical protein n=1 Tax=Streptomyces sp. NPDC052042 TaxID=3365683 RepID=UPI0037D849AF
MAIVSPCIYDAQGQLVHPGRSDIRSAKFSGDFDTGESLTLDRGHVHVHTLTTSGLTADHARQRMNALLARFFARVEDVSGYRKIAMKKTEGIIYCNNNISITYEILYAVETPARARSRRPESPYAGYRRDPSAVAFR